MSMNQFKGKEETENFKNRTVPEQKELSKEKVSPENDEEEVNTKIAQSEKDKLEREQARKIH